MPAFAAEYGIGALEWGRWPATDEIVMMFPDLRRFIPGMKLLIVKNVDVRFPSTDARQPSSGMSSSGPGWVKLPPALVTRISIGSYSFLDAIPHRFDFSELGDVGYNRNGPTSGPLNLCVHLRDGRVVPAMNRHSCAASCEQCRDGGSNSSRAAGDQCYFVAEICSH
jgi:hypothetical protein